MPIKEYIVTTEEIEEALNFNFKGYIFAKAHIVEQALDTTIALLPPHRWQKGPFSVMHHCVRPRRRQ